MNGCRSDSIGMGSRSEPLLVSSPISQTFLELYPKSIRIKRPFTGEPPTPPERITTTIQGFSKKSRMRLRFTGANSEDKIKTQFCMTYADVWPVNGRSLKADLNRFITSVKKSFPRLEYLWIAEFQTRGCPHFHLSMSTPTNKISSNGECTMEVTSASTLIKSTRNQSQMVFSTLAGSGEIHENLYLIRPPKIYRHSRKGTKSNQKLTHAEKSSTNATR